MDVNGAIIEIAMAGNGLAIYWKANGLYVRPNEATSPFHHRRHRLLRKVDA